MILGKYFYTFFLLSFSYFLGAQSVSGYIINENNEPVPYANVFVKELQSGTTTNYEGYFFLSLEPGEYEFAFSSLGYETKVLPIIVKDKEEVQNNIYLVSSSVELDEIVVKANKKDPAYAIIQKVIENKKKYLQQVNSFKSKVYIKSSEIIDEKEKKKRLLAAKQKKAKEDEEEKLEDDPFEKAEKEKKKLADHLNLMEMELILNYQYPKKFKEERTAYKLYGSKAGLFIPQFSETNFNIYRNMVNMKGVNEVPVISPISKTSILSYKYKLIETRIEDGVSVSKIKVIPRKKGNSTCSGYLYINDELHNVNRLDLNFGKGTLRFFDEFNINQKYEEVEAGLWIPMLQTFTYFTKQGKYKSFRGETIIKFSDYESNYTFPEKFFNNEVSVTTKEAYKRDSLYWKAVRPEPLSLAEQKVVSYRDSLKAVTESKEYQDSVQLEYNKVKPIEVFWEGVGWRNNLKKEQIYFGPLPSFMDWEVIGGWRFGPWGQYFRRFENEKMIRVFGGINYGFKNKDFTGNIFTWHRYNPRKLADVAFGWDKDFESINSSDAYLNQLKPSQYILTKEFQAQHKIELVNGLYLATNFLHADRQSVKGLLLNNELNEFFEEDQPLEFDPYQAFISYTTISYTPQQKFMTEPNRKVVLGSKFPTFYLRHTKGWNKVFGSDIDYDFMEIGLKHNVTLGTIGNSNYSIKMGKFLNTNDVRFVDLKRFNQSAPVLYSDPINSFQLLDTSLTTVNFYIEGHHIHHFNGALINNIPIVKLSRIKAVAGGGFLWVKDSNIAYQELFAGLERTFKLGARRRLRFGVYGVLANSNFSSFDSAFKFSIDVIDTLDKDWSF